MSGDSRKDFILATIGNHFGYPASDGAVSHILHSKELNSFLDDASCQVLATRAELHGEVRLIQPYTQLEAGAAADAWLVFFKLSPSVLTPDNLHSNMLVSSLLESPLDSLYHSVQKVYAPVLLRDARWSKAVDPKIQSLLTELEAGLGSVLRRFGKTGVRTGLPTSPSSSFSSSFAAEDADSSELATILNPSDEFQFWAEVALSSTKLASRERAQHFQELFQPVTTHFANLDALSFSESLELVEVTQDTLDDVWKQSEHHPPYPERRMAHLLTVVSDAIGRYVQRKLSGCDFWRGSFVQVKGTLKDGLMVCDKWSSAAELLTGQLWKQYPPHQWKRGPFTSVSLSQLVQRLEEVSRLCVCVCVCVHACVHVYAHSHYASTHAHAHTHTHTETHTHTHTHTHMRARAHTHTHTHAHTHTHNTHLPSLPLSSTPLTPPLFSYTGTQSPYSTRAAPPPAACLRAAGAHPHLTLHPIRRLAHHTYASLPSYPPSC